MKALPAGVTEAQTLTEDLEVGCDVVVVGSGPGGAVTAWRLAEAGLQVVVVDEGGYFTKDRFRGREGDAYPFLYQDGAQRTTKDLGVTILQGKAIGGGSVVNWTTCFRTPDPVLDHWKLKHDVTGFTPADLAPHFAAMEQRLSVAKVPLELVNKNNRALYDGCEKLKIKAETTSRNVLGCAQTGHCGHGCPIDAKQSMLVTCLPDAMKAGAAVLSRCRVERLVYEAGRVVKVEARAKDAFGLSDTGKSITLKPRFVVVSGGAINSPALLLRSGTKDPHDRLGARTFLHPVVVSIARFAEPIEGWRGAPQSVASHQYVDRGDEVGYFLEVGPIHPMLGALTVGGFGALHRDGMRQLAHFSGMLGITVDGFHDDVEGGTVGVTSSGAPVLDYPITERQWRAFRDAQKVLAQIGFAAGAVEVGTAHDPALWMKSADEVGQIDDMPWDVGRVGLFSAHQMGGCGMSEDPKKGVVRSSDLRHHQVENLYVVDGSVFPTSLGVNPQMSIYGLAHFMSGRLLGAMKG